MANRSASLTDELRTLILNGKYRIGDRLDDVGEAVDPRAPSPLRTALRTLASEGLVVRRGGGSSLPPLSGWKKSMCWKNWSACPAS
ncbi:GntR family transcriptional regulator [Nocardia sp. SYP-A9097]|uniref:GntR family transcriptional regulator n=1 Tax=Nocardia sp. SYP-A9097 TaxID=2663237 RepID=UPI001891AEF0